jgi:hypothetical protein
MKRLSGRHLDRIIAISMSAIVLLGMSLRVHLLDGQSFWSDEGISLLRSALPLGEMLRNMPVEHVPGYFVLLFGWLRTAGTSDYALRFLSVLPSVLSVATIYRLATRYGRFNAQAPPSAVCRHRCRSAAGDQRFPGLVCSGSTHVRLATANEPGLGLVSLAVASTAG